MLTDSVVHHKFGENNDTFQINPYVDITIERVMPKIFR